MTNKLPRNITAMGLIVLLNGVTSKPLKAQVPARSPTIPQVIPRDIQPPSTTPQATPQPQQVPPPELFPPSNSTPNPEEQFPETIRESFIIKRFEVVGSTVFSQEELAKVIKEFTNHPITLNELYLARKKITDLYTSKGYIRCGAYIPPQKIQSGIAKIQVVETKLSDIEILGTQRVNPSYIRSRIASGNNGPLNQQILLKSLQLLKLNPLIKNLSANLQAGNFPDEIKLVVEVVEAKTFSTQVILDNARSPSAGSFQRRLQVHEANLLGLGDGLSVGYSNTDASNFKYIGYTLPLNSKNGTLSFNYGTSQSSVIEPPFNILDIKSTSRYYELTLRQPIVQSPKEEFAVGLTASRRESEANYTPLTERVPFPQLGSDDQGRTLISALRFFQEWTARDSTQVLEVRSQFNLGLKKLRGIIVSGVATKSKADPVTLQLQDKQILKEMIAACADKYGWELFPFNQPKVNEFLFDEKYTIDNPSSCSVAKRVESLNFEGKSVGKCVLRDETLCETCVCNITGLARGIDSFDIPTILGVLWASLG